MILIELYQTERLLMGTMQITIQNLIVIESV